MSTYRRMRVGRGDHVGVDVFRGAADGDRHVLDLNVIIQKEPDRVDAGRKAGQDVRTVVGVAAGCGDVLPVGVDGLSGTNREKKAVFP